MKKPNTSNSSSGGANSSSKPLAHSRPAPAGHLNKRRKGEQEALHDEDEITPDQVNDDSAEDSDLNSDGQAGDSDESGSSDESDDVFSLPRRLYFYVHDMDPLELNSKISQCVKALDTAKKVILELNPTLVKLLKKAMERDPDDKKVPPGSGQVMRRLDDDRFLLSLIAVANAKLLDRQGDEAGAISSLREALVWFPRNIEGNYLLGTLLKATATRPSELQSAESCFAKASSVVTALKIERSNAIVESASKRSVAGTVGDLVSMSVKESHFEHDENDLALAEILESEIQSGNAAQEQLALYLLQMGRASESTSLLEALGFKWRLSKEVLNYSMATRSIHNINSNSNKKNNNTINTLTPSVDYKQYLRVFDNALPVQYLSALSNAFRRDSPFWSEHDYDVRSNASRKVGYFSYLYRNLNSRAPANLAEQVVKYVHQLASAHFPEVAECDVGEWWVHSRPHSSGHQLHFDSDETSLENGQPVPVHPVVSVVIYVSGAEVGGPTLMTNQTLGGPLADKGWICQPGDNRILMFDAKYLHGVIPGKGATPSVGARRLTFMIGFWKKICAKDRGPDKAGPGQPYPDATKSKYTWPREMELKLDSNLPIKLASEVPEAFSHLKEIAPESVGAIWEPVDSTRPSPKPAYNLCFQGF